MHEPGERNNPGTSRRGDWKQTYTGRAWWPMDPRADEVAIEDIAHALAMLCRFGGHCTRFYSVAEHSVLVSYLVPEHMALAGLMHDSAEAYVCDIPRPLKPHLSNYKQIEDANWRAIAERFGIDPELPPEIKAADTALLLAEKAELMAPTPEGYSWCVPGKPALVNIRAFPPLQAKRLFLSRFKELTA